MKFTCDFNPNKYYHVFNHSVGNELLFRNKDNYYYFLRKFSHYILPIAKTYAYCLMPNHFHFFLQFRTRNEILDHARKVMKEDEMDESRFDYPKFLMQQFSNFLNSYAKSFNKTFERKGALFLDYTKRVELTNSIYFRNLVCYINNNPVHHGFCLHPGDWMFSSYRSLCNPDFVSQIERGELLEWFNDVNSFEKYHLQANNTLPAAFKIE